MRIKKVIVSVMLVFALVPFGSSSAYAQQKKGDKEVQAFASGFTFRWGGDLRPRTLDLNSSGSFSSSGNSQSFNLSGDLGYFLTRRQEVGAGMSFNVARFEDCITYFSNGEITGESCRSDTFTGLGFNGFYRFHFAEESAKGFPFVGASFSVADVKENFTGNLSARPHVGYKYFVKKNVALDFSVGYQIELNKVDDHRSFYIRDRLNTVNGQLGLTFIF